MKQLVFSIALVFLFVTAAAQVPRYLDPQVVAINKELPRGPVISLDSLGSGSDRVARYLQPLTDWTRTDSGEAVTFASRFRVSFEQINRRHILHLEGVSASFDVLVNGELAGYSQAGTLPVEFDLTDVARQGMNDLQIVVYKDPIAQQKLENGRRAVAPQLLGDVYIFSQPLLRVRDIVVDARVENSRGLLELGVVMKSHRLNPQTYVVLYELLGSEGEVLAWERKQTTIDMRREDTLRFFANVRDITAWRRENPQTYRLRIETRQDGRIRETLGFDIGFRDTENPPVVRNTHSLPTEGVVVVDIDTHLSGPSRKVGGNPSNDPGWLEAYMDRTLAAYHTSKRDPSVVAFSLAHKDSANGICLYETYLALKRLESRRPIIYSDGDWNSD